MANQGIATSDGDSDSYASATESEVDIEESSCVFGPVSSSTNCQPVIISSSSKTEISVPPGTSRPSTPYQLLSRRTCPKRPAPPPPTMVSKSEEKTSFVQQFRGSSEKATSKSDQKFLSNIVSHPVIIKPKDEDDAPMTSFSNLQIKLIDDVSDSEPDALFSSSSTQPDASISSSVSSVTSTLVLSSETTPVVAQTIFTNPPSVSLPFSGYYLPGMSPMMYGDASPIYENIIAGNVNSAVLPYYSTAHPLMPPTQAVIPKLPAALIPQTPSIDSSVAANKERRSYTTALSHSASDPSVSNRVKKTFLTSPTGTYQDLSRLSEEEDEESDHVINRDEWDCVKRSPLRRVKRSDSVVTVAHLYEDILVSSKYKFKVTLTNLSVVVMIAAFFVPNSAAILFNTFRLVFGTLFPAYYSYKAVKTKHVGEYVKWMMYWIVFAFFTCAETITDVFLSFWFPFYYEIKILVVLWLLSPATKGSSFLYKKFVHPWLTKREDDIDDYIAKAKQQGYSTVVQLGTKGVNYATNVIMQTAIKGGGGIVNQLKRSYSTSEIYEDSDQNRNNVKAITTAKENCQVKREPQDLMSSSDCFDSDMRHRAESESSYRPRGHSTGRATRASKARSADVTDLFFHDAPDSSTVVTQRRSPRNQEPAKSPHTPLYREPPLREQLLRKSKYKPATRSKSFTGVEPRYSKLKLNDVSYDVEVAKCLSGNRIHRGNSQSFRMPSQCRV